MRKNGRLLPPGLLLRPATFLQRPLAQDVGIALAALRKLDDLRHDRLSHILGAVAGAQSDSGHFEGNPRARSVSGSNRETLRYGWMGMVGGDQRDAEVDCIPDVSLWHCCATAAHINANLRSVSRCLGSLACSAAFMLSCANQSNTLSMSMVGGPA
jgi:hypothetical protein